MSWVYVKSEPGLWTVGHYDPEGSWHTDSDHGSPKDAGNRCAYLNGGGVGEKFLLAEVERLTKELDSVQVLVETCRAQDEECRRGVERAVRAELIIRRARRELNARLPELDGEVAS